jgi:predicted metal-dependent hydrolase
MSSAKHTPAAQLDLLSEPPQQQFSLGLETPEQASEVQIRVRRTARATEGRVRIRREGEVLEVSAPADMPLANIEQAVRSHVGAHEATHGMPELPDTWAEGTCFSFLGGTLAVRLGKSSPGVRRRDEDLLLPLPPNAESSRIRDQVHAFLQSEARWVLAEQLQACAARFECEPPEWRITFSNKMLAGFEGGVLRLHWKLLLLGPAEIEASIARVLASRPVAKEAASLFE